MTDPWTSGNAYERFMGRWSARMADRFLEWLGPSPSLAWLDVGCGTGALTAAICRIADPARVVACDPSPDFADYTRRRITDVRLTVFPVGVDKLPGAAGEFDRIVAGLMLNFTPDPLAAVRAMALRTQPEGTVAAYVWDYAQGMEFLRRFWDEATAGDPNAVELDEGGRFPMCQPDALASLFSDAGLRDVSTTGLEIATRFASFDDYWEPFLGGTGPAPGYVATLTPALRDGLRDRLRARLDAFPDGSIGLRARAWAVRASKP